MKANTIKLALASIIADKTFQPRAEINSEAVADYKQAVITHIAECKQKGADITSPFPPLEVTEIDGKHYLFSGFHRRLALKEAGFDGEVECVVHKLSKDQAYLKGIETNLKNGVRMTSEDRKVALARILKIEGNENLSNVELGKMLGCSEYTIRGIRPANKDTGTRIVNKGGKKIKIDVKNVGKKTGPAKKEDKKAAKKGGDKPSNPNGKKDDPAKVDEAYEKALIKIEGVLNKDVEKSGTNARKAIESGALALSKADVKTWAQTSDARILKVAPLIIGGNRWSPARAFKFIDEAIEPKSKVEDLINLAVAGKGAASVTIDGYEIIVLDKASFKVERNIPLRLTRCGPKDAKSLEFPA